MVDTMGMSKQKGYALEALCLLATAGIVGIHNATSVPDFK